MNWRNEQGIIFICSIPGVGYLFPAQATTRPDPSLPKSLFDSCGAIPYSNRFNVFAQDLVSFPSCPGSNLIPSWICALDTGELCGGSWPLSGLPPLLWCEILVGQEHVMQSEHCHNKDGRNAWWKNATPPPPFFWLPSTLPPPCSFFVPQTGEKMENCPCVAGLLLAC